MTRKEVKEMLPVFQAYAEGKEIESLVNGKYYRVLEICNGMNPKDYRIKPEPKYRPFANAEECWQEMQKHQPFGWLISQNGEVNSLIISIDNEGLVIGDRNNGVMGFVTATDLFKIKFADGTPFGIKVEEK
jgi:hypothetical protein